jgi:predicted Zn-dependent protease
MSLAPPPGPACLPARRRWLLHGCAACAALFGGRAWSQPGSEAAPAGYSVPPRHVRPDIGSDEGGLWALFDREETRLRRGQSVLKDAALTGYLKDVACKLVGEHCPDLRVYAVRTPHFNALMAPNGMMQVWTGLLLRLENEAQLAAVIGHEIGHYLQRHSLARLRDAKGRSAFMTLMAPFGLVGLVGQLAALGGMAAYSREHEQEADRIGVQLVQRAGWHPGEAARIWLQLRQELSAGAGGDPAERSVMFATHPGVAERHLVLQELAQGASGELGEQAYAQRLEPVLGQLCDDELARAQYDESVALFKRLSTGRPGHARLRFFLGESRRLRGGAGDHDAALEDFAALAAMADAPAQRHRSIGYILRARGDKAGAAAAFEAYLLALPGAPDAGLVQSYVSELKT